MIKLPLVCFATLLLWVSQAKAQDEIVPQSSSLPATSGSGAPAEGKLADGELPAPKRPQAKVFSQAEIKKECAKWSGRYISYYETIYKVEGCKRRQLLVQEADALRLQGIKVTSVEGETVAKIPLGTPLNAPKKEDVSCKRIEGQYLMNSAEDMFFVEKCQKRAFSDYDSYLEHAKKRGKKGLAVLELSDDSIFRIADGQAMPSTLDQEYKKLLDADEGVDVIPLAEACKGLNGKFVAYYSKIYRVEKCRKQPVDPELFLKRFPKYEPLELSSDQWISIPTGQNYKL